MLGQAEEAMVQIYGPRIVQSVAEHTWDAIRVSQVSPELVFGGAWICDDTAGIDYTSREDFPANIPYGHLVNGNYNVKNIGDVTLRVYLLIEFINPAGTVVFSAYDPSPPFPSILNPGGPLTRAPFFGIRLDMVGAWLIYGKMEYEIA